ncbi:MAG: S8 family serine peptidase [Oligoflexia bacterium]|nr:S8 family serine peptidase [Oligoflexia bacterium]
MRSGIRTLLITGVLFLANALSGCRATNTSANRSGDGTPATSDPQPVATIRPLDLLPGGTVSLAIGKKLYFTVTGGIPPYIFAASSGSIDGAGAFQAPYLPDTVTVSVTDQRGVRSEALVNVTVGALTLPNDPKFSLQKGLSQDSDSDTDAPEAWAIHQDCRSVLIAILDSGIDLNHSDLLANLWHNPLDPDNGVDDDGNGLVDDTQGWNLVENTRDPTDDNFHGTHVAGITGAVGNNGLGIAGVCWKASLVAIKFLDANGAGFSSDAIDGIDYAVSLGAKIINASFGGADYNQLLKDAIDRADSAGVLFVSAAGNSAQDNDAIAFYPGNYDSPNVLTVAAVDSSDALASFSNRGATQVDIAAPGTSILSTFPSFITSGMTAAGKTTALYDSLNGTSMAAPFISGAAALLWSFEPGLSHLEVRARLLERADALPVLDGKVAGGRRLNIRKSLYVP